MQLRRPALSIAVKPVTPETEAPLNDDFQMLVSFAAIWISFGYHDSSVRQTESYYLCALNDQNALIVSLKFWVIEEAISQFCLQWHPYLNS